MLDAVPQLARRQEPELDQEAPERRGRAVRLVRAQLLLHADHAGSQQALAEPVDALVRGGEHHLAGVQVDRLRALAVLEVEEARLRGGMHQVEQVAERERAHVGGQHQLPIEGQRDGLRTGLLEQQRPGRRGEHADGLRLGEAKPPALLRIEPELAVCRHTRNQLRDLRETGVVRLFGRRGGSGT
jgi:hypothetical protein